jgi:hypothetical protein
MTGVLLLGFLVGLRHALEADHLAAVATLTSRTSSLADAVRHGLAWGLGHTLTLFIIGGAVIILGGAIPDAVVQILEAMVGAMLVGLGLDVMRRILKERVHFHVHAHQDGVEHFHAHSHRGEKSHNPRAHAHGHRERFPFRALFIGLVHGTAGSAALIVLALGTAETVQTAIAYLVVFGLGSMVGMGVLSAIIAVPLRYRPARLTWLYNGLHACVGLFSIGLGASVVFQAFS